MIEHIAQALSTPGLCRRAERRMFESRPLLDILYPYSSLSRHVTVRPPLDRSNSPTNSPSAHGYGHCMENKPVT